MAYTAKLAALGILFGMSIISGLVLPLIVLRLLATKCESRLFRRIISLLNCFAGGVFLSTTLLTLLPEAREAMEEVTNVEFPCTELLMAAGFLVILSIESLAAMIYTRYSKGKQTVDIITTETNGCTLKSAKNISTLDDHACSQIAVTGNEEQNQHKTSKAHSHEHEHENEGGDTHVHVTGITNLRNVFLLVALSIHMIFDGLEVALMKEDSDVWSVLVAVTVHKVLIFFGIGLSICKDNSLLRFVIAMVYMSLVSPVGIGIGIAVTSNGETDAMVTSSAVLQGFAVGTFFYVAIFEILTKEFLGAFDKFRLFKCLATVIGCGLFALIKYFT